MQRIRVIVSICALLVTGVVIGAVSQHATSAIESSGERPVSKPIPPCRIADNRPGELNIGVPVGPLGPEQTLTVQGRGSTGECNIPADAIGLLLNVTAVGATAQTNLRVHPANTPLPNASNLNPGPGQPPTPNAVTTLLSSEGLFNVYNQNGSVSVVIDVNGYLVDHNHDDRYYTKAQVDDRIPTFRTVFEERALPIDGVEAYEISCPPGESAISGGYALADGSLGAGDWLVLQSFQGGFGDTFDPRVWTFEVVNGTTEPGALAFQVNCVSAPTEFTQRSSGARWTPPISHEPPDR